MKLFLRLMKSWRYDGITLCLYRYDVIPLWRNTVMTKFRYNTPKINKTDEALTHFWIRASLKKMAASYSPALHCSTICASGLNFSVRNGKRWDPAAIATWNIFVLTSGVSRMGWHISHKDWSLYFIHQAAHSWKHALHSESLRAISSARLWRHRLYTCTLSTS